MTKTSRRLIRRRDVRGGRTEGPGPRASGGQTERWGPPDPVRLDALIGGLDSEDPLDRGRARSELVRMGRGVVPGLTRALQSQSSRVRWEAAMALDALHDPMSAPALVQAMEDDMLEVRWAAADGVLALEHEGLVSLLRGLIAHSGSIRLRESAHRVLSAMVHGEGGQIVKPVLDALESAAPVATLPIAAFTALNELKSHNRSSG